MKKNIKSRQKWYTVTNINKGTIRSYITSNPEIALRKAFIEGYGIQPIRFVYKEERFIDTITDRFTVNWHIYSS